MFNKACHALTTCKNTLQGHLDDVISAIATDPKTMKACEDYFNWITLQTELIKAEECFVLPSNIIPNKVTQHDYNYLHQDKRAIIDKYYKQDTDTGLFIINSKKTSILQEERETLIHSLVLRRGSVVWVNFGFNIGNEFRGKHPAIILKNIRNVMIVVPLSSRPPNRPEINIEVNNVNGLPSSRIRWASILRIVPISILRIDFNSPTGDVKGAILSEISNKIAAHGIK